MRLDNLRMVVVDDDKEVGRLLGILLFRLAARVRVRQGSLLVGLFQIWSVAALFLFLLYGLTEDARGTSPPLISTPVNPLPTPYPGNKVVKVVPSMDLDTVIAANPSRTTFELANGTYPTNGFIIGSHSQILGVSETGTVIRLLPSSNNFTIAQGQSVSDVQIFNLTMDCNLQPGNWTGAIFMNGSNLLFKWLWIKNYGSSDGPPGNGSENFPLYTMNNDPAIVSTNVHVEGCRFTPSPKYNTGGTSVVKPR